MPQMVVHRYTKYTKIGMMDKDNQIVVYKASDGMADAGADVPPVWQNTVSYSKAYFKCL